MKKTIIFTLTLFAGICAQAQEIIFDALTWSENDYVGTARTMGMGNAVTAVGGDPGSFVINPAGGAVSSYSQVELTPGGSVSMATSGWNSGSRKNNSFKDTQGKFIFPNGGISFNFNTGNSSGLVRWSFGFTANGTNIYNSEYSGGGDNSKSSFAAYLATYADNNHLSSKDLTDYNTDYCCSAAYNSYVIDRLSDFTDDHYIGTTENIDEYGNISLGGTLNQTGSHRIFGTKMDYVFNFGFDISNIIYLGANIGITNINYELNDGISERALDRNLFDTGFKELNYSYNYRAAGSGVYGKFGIIATPIDGLRLGAVIQTPTSVRITEYTQHAMTHEYEKHGLATSPQSGWTYKVVSPMRFNVGLAYTLGSVAMLSIDYERADYGMTRFKETDFSDKSYFDGLNNQIRGMYGDTYKLLASNMVRAGIEIKPIPEFAIRAGYNYTTSGRTDRSDTHTCSFGMGYISKGSFYCDVAAKLGFMPTEYIKVYDDYSYVSDQDGNYAMFEGPVMSGTRKLLNIVGTLGWRF